MNSIKTVSIKNYKSIRELENFPLKNLNILIGPNGAGKSNFISFFKLLNHIIREELQYYVSKLGKVDSLLYFGQKNSKAIEGRIDFGANHYEFRLEVSYGGKLFFASEIASVDALFLSGPKTLGVGHFETELKNYVRNNPDSSILSSFVDALESWKVYHFHDTSDTAGVKQSCEIEDNRFLRQDASNLAAFLYNLKSSYPQHYENIISTIRLVAPFFKDFVLIPQELNKSIINLEWAQIGSDQYFNAHHLSDGTLRMICLTTLLMQPNLPSMILLDEPELGLHPYAINLLASLLRSASTRAQIIVSTQSAALVSQFAPEDLIIVESQSNQSVFKRLNSEDLETWLEDYTLGELWEKNLLGGRP